MKGFGKGFSIAKKRGLLFALVCLVAIVSCVYGVGRIIMEQNRMVNAVIDEGGSTYYRLGVSASEDGCSGSWVEKTPNKESYLTGTSVTLTAHSGSNCEFVKWSHVQDPNTTISVVMNRDRDIVAYFRAKAIPTPTPIYYNVVARSEGYGTATVSPNGSVVAGTQVTYSANPVSGYIFDHWECNRSGGPFTTAIKKFQVDSDITCTAFFKQSTELFTLRVNVSSDENGVAYIGNNINLKEEKIEYGLYEKITAKANDGYSFDKWVCRGQNFIITLDDSITSISPDRDVTCTAEFKVLDDGGQNDDDSNNDDYIVSVHPNNNDRGSVAFSDSGNQRESFDHETETSIVATPNEGFEFVGWSDGSTDNPRAIEVDDDRSYVAIFEPIGGSTSDDSDDENDGEKKDDEKDDGKESDDEESDDGSIAVPDTGMNTNSGNNNTLIGSIIMPVTLVALVGGHLVSRRKRVRFDK